MRFRNLLVVVALSLCLCCTAAVPAQADTLRLLDNNRVPQKIVVILTGGTLQFVRDLANTVKTINNTEQLSGSDRIKVHVVASSKDLVRQLGLSAEDLADLIEVNDRFSSSDIWAQDMGELAAVEANGKLSGAVFDSRRGRGLGPLPKILADLWGHKYFANPTSEGAHGDYGGNIEVTPDNILYAGNTMTGPCEKFFRENGYKDRMVLLDTRWLSVGHIDETMMVIPTAHAPGGYSICYADPVYGLELLAGATDADLQKISSNYRAFLTRVRDALRREIDGATLMAGTPETEFIALNRTIGDLINKNVATFKNFIREKTGDRERAFADIAWPNLYEGRMYNGRPSGCCAYMPGVVNLTVLRNHLLVPATRFPPFDKVIEGRFRAQGNIVHFIDDQPYHSSMGEIHCGTNVLRDPNRSFITPRDIARIQKIKATFRAIHGDAPTSR